MIVDPAANYQNTLQFCGVNASTNAVFGANTCAAESDNLYDANGILGTGTTYTNSSKYLFWMSDEQGTNDWLLSEDTSLSADGFGTIALQTGPNYYSRLGNVTTNELIVGATNMQMSDHTYYMTSEIGSTTNDGDGTIGQRIKKDGRALTLATDATQVSYAGTGTQMVLGASASNTSSMTGRIGEVIAYAGTAVQTPAETQRIESYMALKYGKTLSNVDTLAGIDEGKYVLSDGTTFVWNGSLSSGVAAADAAFHYNVAGIGRDDVSDLYQKIGKSINNDEIMTVALDNNFTVANSDASRVGTFAADKDFLMWGHQGGSLFFDTTVSTANSNTRLGRYWKMKTTGITSKAVNIQFSNPNVLRIKNGQQYVLLESTSATFGSPVELATANGVAAGTTGSVTFANVTVTGGRYYTLATKTIAPGGVTTKLINGIQVKVLVDNTWNDSFASPTTWYANDVIALENVGTGTSFAAPIATGYVDHIAESNTAGITNGFWDDNYATEFNGYIVIPQTGSNYVFEVCGTTGTGACAGGVVDDAAQMWIDKNNDGLLDDSERIINVVGTAATSASQSLTAGNVRFRVRYKEVTSNGFLRLTIQSSSAPVIAERELTSADYRVEAPLALWLKANSGAYDDAWTTRADLAVNNDKVNTWENSALTPNNDIIAAQAFVDGTGMNFNDATSANAINFNPTLGAGAAPGIRDNADNGSQDLNDYFGYTNGLAYTGGANTNFFVGMDPTVTGSSEMFYSYGYDDASGSTTADTQTYLREVTSGSVGIGQAGAGNSTVVSSSGVLVSSVPFSVTGNTAAVLAPATAADDVVQTVFAYGLQRNQAVQNQRLHIGGNNNIQYELGDHKDIGGHDYNGTTAEVIHYPAELSGTERYRVESYLAIKYGLTLSNADVVVAQQAGTGSSGSTSVTLSAANSAILPGMLIE